MGAKRICAEPGCGTATETTRCAEHTRDRDSARGSRQSRGYDGAHDRERASWQRRLDAGARILCWRALHPELARVPCKTPKLPIDPSDWHLGHADDDRSRTMGPEHAGCNLHAVGVLGH